MIFLYNLFFIFSIYPSTYVVVISLVALLKRNAYNFIITLTTICSRLPINIQRRARCHLTIFCHFSLNSPPLGVLESSRGPVKRYNRRRREEGMFVHRPCARVKSIGSRCRRNRFPPWRPAAVLHLPIGRERSATRLTTTGIREKETRSVLSSQPVHLESCRPAAAGDT